MQEYKRAFIEFMVEAGVLTFGDFTTKSGRKTPYFINTGNYRTGGQMRRLAGFYAEAITDAFAENFDVLFGPAYKGIPLAVATSMALDEKYNREVAFCFNRKEVKDHGEGGSLVGHKMQDGDRVLLIEDVTTAGTSIRETVPILKAAAKVELAGLVISVDRMEKGTGEVSALAELRGSFGFQTTSIVNILEIVEHLHNKEINGTVLIDDAMKGNIEAYLAEHGGKDLA